MKTATLPPHGEMLEAFLSRDASYDGLFYTGVTTTGIFCRPTCSARKPLPGNIEFFPSAQGALVAGFRPCRRCRPLEQGGTPPEWLAGLLRAVEEDPSRRWTDQDLRNISLSPDRVRQWFKAEHDMTFHAYSRARRLGQALGQIHEGSGVTAAAFDSGYESLSGFNEAFRKILGAAPTSLGDAPVVHLTRIATPLGAMLAGATTGATGAPGEAGASDGAERVCLLEFADRRMLETQFKRLQRHFGCVFVPGTTPLLQRLAEEVDAYFQGELKTFTVPIADPGTEFQRRVWDRLKEIPYGETRSYTDLARAIDRPSAVRAVAGANGDNRLAIIIPCHRVIGADGRLSGYGGGVWRKQRLLDLEVGRTRGAPDLPRESLGD